MRKRLITPSPQDVPSRDEGWLDLGRMAVVEFTSEEKEYPVEAALDDEDSSKLADSDPGKRETLNILSDLVDLSKSTKTVGR